MARARQRKDLRAGPSYVPDDHQAEAGLPQSERVLHPPRGCNLRLTIFFWPVRNCRRAEMRPQYIAVAIPSEVLMLMWSWQGCTLQLAQGQRTDWPG
jgi:hypothetical protein